MRPARGDTLALMADQGAEQDEGALQALFAHLQRNDETAGASFERFRVLAAPLLAAGEPVSRERAAELCLASACGDGLAPALAQFDACLMPSARAAMAQVLRPREDLVDDAIQELRSRLFTGDAPRIRAYSGRGPLWKWLRITAVRVAHDLRRVRQIEGDGDGVLEMMLADDPDPEVRLMRERFRGLFHEALRDALAQLSARERTLVLLRYVKNQGIDTLAVPFRAHRATVARWLQDIRHRLLDHVCLKLENKIPRLTEKEMHSLWRAVRSQVHVSLSQFSLDDGSGTGGTG
jgi:RNA polymerase sigma-70 factor, ECF subfamily